MIQKGFFGFMDGKRWLCIIGVWLEVEIESLQLQDGFQSAKVLWQFQRLKEVINGRKY